MLPLFRLINRLKTVSSGRRLLLMACLMIFFWTIFDGMVSYAAPILITQRGYSNTAMGLIIASSSVAGAVFDFILSKYLKNTNYLRIFLMILLISFTYPLLLWFSSGLAMFLFAMAAWGLYYDLYTFGIYDFLGRHCEDDDRTQSVGILTAFRSLALLLAPLIAGLVMTEVIGFDGLMFSFLFLIIAAVFFMVLFIHSPEHHHTGEDRHLRSVNFFTELKLWRQIGLILAPVLAFNILTYIFDSVFWTIGPLFSSLFPDFKDFSGLLLALYTLPTLFVVWFMEPIVNRFGNKRTAHVTFLIANLILIPVGYTQTPWLILVLIFLSSIASSMTFPAIDGAYVDYVAEAKKYAPEIEGLNDFTTNVGYIIGPMFAGLFSDHIGISHSFSLLGAVNIVLILILMALTPRQINIILRR